MGDPSRGLTRWGLFSHSQNRPTIAKAVPTGPDYIHEIKYDGYRLVVARSGRRVRLITSDKGVMDALA